MPAAAPARLPLKQPLEEGLALMFCRLEAEPAPKALVGLADRLESAWRRRPMVAAEARRFG